MDIDDQARYLIENGYVLDISFEQLVKRMTRIKKEKKLIETKKYIIPDMSIELKNEKK